MPSLSLVFRNPRTVLLPACFSCSRFLSPRPLANFFLPHQFSFLSSFYPASFSGFMFVAEGHKQVVPLALYSTKVTHHDVCVLPWLSLIRQKCRTIKCDAFLKFFHWIELSTPGRYKIRKKPFCWQYKMFCKRLTAVCLSLSALAELRLVFLVLNVFSFYIFLSCRWDKQVISIREARALPKNNAQEWKNKFICIEGKHFNGVIFQGHHGWNVSLCLYNSYSVSLCFRAIWTEQRRPGSPWEDQVWNH